MNQFIKIKKDDIEYLESDIYICIDHIVSIEACSFNKCIVKLSNDSTIILKMNADEFLNLINYKL